MDLKLREAKKRSKVRLLKSFSYAINGIVYAFKYEQNIIVHFLSVILVIITGFILNISVLEWLIIIIIMALVISLELVNSAIEATVDLVTSEAHTLAKVAKDCASGAVLISAVSAMIIGAIIFIPKLATYIN